MVEEPCKGRPDHQQLNNPPYATGVQLATKKTDINSERAFAYPFSVRTWAPALAPLAIHFILLVLFMLYPETASWTDHRSFNTLPYILLGIVTLLGVIFIQNRISLVAILMAAITLLADHFFFGKDEPASGNAVLFLGALYIPVLLTMFYHLQERGTFTVHGMARAMIVLSAILVLLILPRILPMPERVETPLLLRHLSGAVQLPIIALIAFLLSIPILLIRRSHESPLLGPMFIVAILFALTAMNLKSTAWKPVQARSVLLTFMSGSAATLAWAILESSWRHAHMDELTDLPGRRSLKHHMARLRGTYAIAVLDIDHFKKINDKYGHDVGDQALRFIASHLRANNAGKAYRFGGEEFVIICEGDDQKETTAALNELREDIASKPFQLRSAQRPKSKPGKTPRRQGGARTSSIKIRVSIGVARISTKHNGPQQVLESADKALYRAKDGGRNKVVVSGR